MGHLCSLGIAWKGRISLLSIGEVDSSLRVHIMLKHVLSLSSTHGKVV